MLLFSTAGRGSPACGACDLRLHDAHNTATVHVSRRRQPPVATPRAPRTKRSLSKETHEDRARNAPLAAAAGVTQRTTHSPATAARCGLLAVGRASAASPTHARTGVLTALTRRRLNTHKQRAPAVSAAKRNTVAVKDTPTHALSRHDAAEDSRAREATNTPP